MRNLGSESFAVRPVFATFTPWDGDNFDPSKYLSKTAGGVVSGSTEFSGGLTASGGLTTSNLGMTNAGAPTNAKTYKFQTPGDGSWIWATYNDNGTIGQQFATFYRSGVTINRVDFDFRPFFQGKTALDTGNLNLAGQTPDTSGAFSAAQFMAILNAVAPLLPTTLPSAPGLVWNNGGTLSIS